MWIHSETRTWHEITYSQMQQHTDKYSQRSSVIWPVWLNGWVFVHKLSGCGFECSCSHINYPGHAAIFIGSSPKINQKVKFTHCVFISFLIDLKTKQRSGLYSVETQNSRYPSLISSCSTSRELNVTSSLTRSTKGFCCWRG